MAFVPDLLLIRRLQSSDRRSVHGAIIFENRSSINLWVSISCMLSGISVL